jgi:hypothetical protein
VPLNRRLVRLAALGALALAVPSTIAPAASPRAPRGRPCPPVWSSLGGFPSTGYVRLNDVHALSPDRAWAVGMTGHWWSGWNTYAARWDGRKWTRVPTPNRPETSDREHNELNGIDGASGRDLHAVGAGLVLRWDGEAWRAVPPSLPGWLSGVDVRVPTDGWAAGVHVAFRWDGRRWSGIPIPLWAGSVDATSATAALAVGSVSSGEELVPAAARWDGRTWTSVPVPERELSLLFDVKAFSRRVGWAVGGASWDGEGARTPLVLRWDGAAWTTTPVPELGPGATLRGIDGPAPGDLWAVGSASTPAEGFEVGTVALHWDGREWQVVEWDEEPNASFRQRRLRGVSATARVVWAVGARASMGERYSPLVRRVCPVRVLDAAPAPADPAPLGRAVFFSFPPSNTREHTVADASGFGLFDSGPREPGSSYMTPPIPAAGAYPLGLPQAPGAALGVRPLATPIPEGEGGGYRVVWATEEAPAGAVHDVRVRPAGGSWVYVRFGSADREGVVHLAVPGRHEVQARMRDPQTGAATGWSPSVVLRG